MGSPAPIFVIKLQQRNMQDIINLHGDSKLKLVSKDINLLKTVTRPNPCWILLFGTANHPSASRKLIETEISALTAKTAGAFSISMEALFRNTYAFAKPKW